MNAATDLEGRLARDLRRTAADVPVPPMPDLALGSGSTGDRVRRPWLPILVAAVVVLIVVSTVIVSRTGREDRREPPPAGPSPTGISTAAPTVPYVDAEGRLFVAGRQVQGTWSGVQWMRDAWIAGRTDGRTFFAAAGYGKPLRVGTSPTTALLSANGKYGAALSEDASGGHVNVFETRFGGEGVGGLDIDLGKRESEGRLYLSALTDDGLVVLSSITRTLLWNPTTGEQVVMRKLDETGEWTTGVTAPDQQVQGMSPAGPVWTDGSGGQAYVGDVDASGRITRLVLLPDSLAIPNTSRTWSVQSGSEGKPAAGFATSTTLRLRNLADGTTQVVQPPAGHRFGAAEWEDDLHLLVTVFDDHDRQGLARCGVVANGCVLVRLPR